MADQAAYRHPRCAPRVRKTEAARLYRGTADGILDHDAIDEVGYGLRFVSPVQNFIYQL